MGARREENLRTAAEEIDASGQTVAWRRTDITNADDCDRLVATAVERFGRVDAVVNCAALDTVFGGLEDADFDQWRAALETNLIGSLQMCKSAIPALKERGGAVVFVGSQAMYLPQLVQPAYAASKAGLLSATYYLAKELGPHKIRVNTIVPSWMWGPPVEAYVNYLAETQGVPTIQVIEGIIKDMPLGEMPTDGDIAEAVVFFASDRARMITGQSLLANAGELMR
jgi:NAD(P)-dependent dehydrogenase (short-subunit alcohol dehydrogenase family)